jgi:predicted TIM-barrel fold metal-dependent hydrolase
VDTTIGCMLRLDDDFYPHDKEFLREIFIKWQDRILFGTDDNIGGGDHDSNPYDFDSSLRRHIRFLTKLDLPGEVFDKISHGNFERIHGIKGL